MGEAFSYFLFFGAPHEAHGILAPQPGIEPTLLALEACSLNQWTTREVQERHFRWDGQEGLLDEAAFVCKDLNEASEHEPYRHRGEGHFRWRAKKVPSPYIQSMLGKLEKQQRGQNG